MSMAMTVHARASGELQRKALQLGVGIPVH